MERRCRVTGSFLGSIMKKAEKTPEYFLGKSREEHTGKGEKVMDRSPESLKEMVKGWIEDFVAEAGREGENIWGKPLVGFAKEDHPYIQSLKQIIGPDHQLPKEVMPQAETVIAYYVPFLPWVAQSNQQLICEEAGKPAFALASAGWALAYERTNAMMGQLNQVLIKRLKERGFQGAVSPQTAFFDREKLISNWSHRHFAYAAGLGTFGLNHMLISRSGCCGRYGSLVTDLPVQGDPMIKEPWCLYQKNGSCGVCVSHCLSGALTRKGYDRTRCYAVLRKNAAVYDQFGTSYETEEENDPELGGSEVCGKCVTGLPCSFTRP